MGAAVYPLGILPYGSPKPAFDEKGYWFPAEAMFQPEKEVW